MNDKKDILGQGIDKFFNSSEKETLDSKENITDDSLVLLDIDSIIANEYQPRTSFDDEKLLELSESIKENGILQPLTVIINKEGKYELIAGERRLRASKIAGIEQVPVIIKKAIDTQKKSILAILENLQRENLNCIELALSYKKVMKDFGIKQEELSKKLGVPRASIANSLRLLTLPEDVLNYLEKGKLSQGHGKILASIKDNEKCIEIAKKTVYGDLSVKKLNELIKKESNKSVNDNEVSLDKTVKSRYQKENSLLIESTGLPFEIKDKKDSGGKILIHFDSDDELAKILNTLTKK